ncbi:hypothetical protein [Longilinea arvoryzae]|uniref:hypothetical protein n=1 Tax=Longilinea arvoryzae TaxID=360412 RepID=UPI0012601F2D|nr:hypothetical protein [Longilinea arvoryzae]
MEKSLVSAICKQVYRRFPEMEGRQPRVKAQGEEQVLLIFSAKVASESGHSIEKTVRVVANSGGKIIKMSESR